MTTIDNRRQKILYVITKSNWGGAQRYVYDLARNLPAANYDVAVAAGGNGELLTRLQNAGVRVIPLTDMRNRASLSNALTTSRRLRQIVRSEQPDVLHLNSSIAGLLGVLAGRMAGVPRVVFTAHGWAFNEERPWWQRFPIKILHWLTVILSHRTIAVSSALAQQMNWLGAARKMTVIHNGIGPIEFYPRAQARDQLIERVSGLAQHRPDYWGVTIAELHPTKQLHLTIHAVAKLKAYGLSYCHTIIGDGALRTELETLITELELEDTVFLAGKLPDAARWLRAFDVFVLNSRSEALAYVLQEARRARLPIVASNTGGIPEAVAEYGAAALVPIYDTLATVEAMQSALHTQVPEDTDISFKLDTMLAKTTALYQSS